MTLERQRNIIDKADQDIVQAFIKRMDAVDEIGQIKKEENLPLDHPNREEEILEGLKDKKYSKELIELYKKLFEISKDYQEKLIK